jgi:hypothetical protein
MGVRKKFKRYASYTLTIIAIAFLALLGRWFFQRRGRIWLENLESMREALKRAAELPGDSGTDNIV